MLEHLDGGHRRRTMRRDQCAEICAEVFVLHDDGLAYLAYVRDVGASGYGPDGEPQLKMHGGLADVPVSLEDAVIDCPGECIFIERPPA